jgi:hypothetical protein
MIEEKKKKNQSRTEKRYNGRRGKPFLFVDYFPNVMIFFKKKKRLCWIHTFKREHCITVANDLLLFHESYYYYVKFMK